MTVNEEALHALRAEVNQADRHVYLSLEDARAILAAYDAQAVIVEAAMQWQRMNSYAASITLSKAIAEYSASHGTERK